MLQGLTALFVISYDAYVDAAWRLAKSLRAEHITFRFLVMTKDGKPFFADALLDTLQSLGSVSFVDHADVPAQVSQQQDDIIFLFFAGLDVERSIRALHKARKNPPVCITCFAGILLHGQEAGFSQRLASDIILFNSRKNLNDYQAFCQRIGASPQNALLFGFPALLQQPKRSDIATPPNNVVYIDQTIIPAGRKDRLAIAQGLLAYARQFPQRRLTVLMRDTATNRSVHPGDFALDALILEAAGAQSMPTNLHFSSERASVALDTCDLCIGMSSAVLIHSMARGIPTAVLGDVGWSPVLGNTLYRGSGMESSLPALLRDALPPPPAAAWLEQTVSFPQEHLHALGERIAQLRTAASQGVLNDAVAKKRFARTLLIQKIRKPLRPLKRMLKALA